jgi:transposase
MKLPRAHHLTVEELAGQLLIPELTVEFLNHRSSELTELLRQLERLQPAGLILWGNHPVDIRLRMEQIQQVVRFPLLFLAQPETGLQPAIPHTTPLPHFQAWGMVHEETPIRAAASVLAREARAAGFNTLLVPPLDTRFFFIHPNYTFAKSVPNEEVWSLAAPIIRAVQQEGVLAIPYLTPPDEEAPIFSEAFARFPLAEIHAFQLRCIAPGLPQSLEESLLPLIRRWQQHGFRGLVMATKPFRSFKPEYDTPLRETLKAGLGPFTLLHRGIFPSSLWFSQMENSVIMDEAASFHARLVHLLQKDEAVYRAACRTVDNLFRIKKELHRHQPQLPHFKRIYKIFQQSGHQEVARELAAKAVRLLHRKWNFRFQPVAYEKIHHIMLTNHKTLPGPFTPLSRLLASTGASITTFHPGNFPDPKTIHHQLPHLTIVSLHNTFTPHSRCRFSREKLKLLIQTYLDVYTPVVLFVFGNPDLLLMFDWWKDVHAALIFFTDVPAAQQLAFDLLWNGLELPPELPETWSAFLPRG